MSKKNWKEKVKPEQVASEPANAPAEKQIAATTVKSEEDKWQEYCKQSWDNLKRQGNDIY